MDNSENPLPVTEIKYDDELSVRQFMFSEIKIDEVSNNLVFIQKYLNVHYKKYLTDNNILLRVDGYFDKVTENLIKKYQTDTSIEVSGIYDFKLAMKMYTNILKSINDYKNHYWVKEVIDGTY